MGRCMFELTIGPLCMTRDGASFSKQTCVIWCFCLGANMFISICMHSTDYTVGIIVQCIQFLEVSGCIHYRLSWQSGSHLVWISAASFTCMSNCPCTCALDHVVWIYVILAMSLMFLSQCFSYILVGIWIFYMQVYSLVHTVWPVCCPCIWSFIQFLLRSLMVETIPVTSVDLFSYLIYLHILRALKFWQGKWEGALECCILSDHFCPSCQKCRVLTGKFLSGRKSSTQWYLSSSFLYAASCLSMAYTQRPVQIRSTGCVSFLRRTVGLSWSWELLLLWHQVSWCSSWQAPR